MRWMFLIPSMFAAATITSGLLGIWNNDGRWGCTAFLFGIVTLIATLIVGFWEADS